MKFQKTTTFKEAGARDAVINVYWNLFTSLNVGYISPEILKLLTYSKGKQPKDTKIFSGKFVCSYQSLSRVVDISVHITDINMI